MMDISPKYQMELVTKVIDKVKTKDHAAQLLD